MNIKAVNPYTNIISFDLAKIRKVGIFSSNYLTPLQWYENQTDKPTLVCNCGLFSGAEPVFTLKIDGKVLIKDSLYRGLAIKGTQFNIGNIDEIPSDDFVSGVPVITYNGTSQVTLAWIDTLKSISGKEPRTVFGYDNNKCYVMCIDGRQTNKLGATLAELPKICLDNGLANAVNFDGGYSSMTVVNGKIVNQGAQYRGVNNVFALWEVVNMEWKEPNWTWIWTKYAQVDKNGNVKVQNNDYAVAEMNAKKDGYAVWEKATKKRLYPVDVAEPEKPAVTDTGEKAFLENIKKLVDERLGNLNG